MIGSWNRTERSERMFTGLPPVWKPRERVCVLPTLRRDNYGVGSRRDAATVEVM